MKRFFSILLLLSATFWFCLPGAIAHAQAGMVHTYSVTPKARAKTHPSDEKSDSRRKQKKDGPYKRSVHRQHSRVRHTPVELASLGKVASTVRRSTIAFDFFPAVPPSTYHIPSLVCKRGPPAV